jgi:hypothetical protein
MRLFAQTVVQHLSTALVRMHEFLLDVYMPIATDRHLSDDDEHLAGSRDG